MQNMYTTGVLHMYYRCKNYMCNTPKTPHVLHVCYTCNTHVAHLVVIPFPHLLEGTNTNLTPVKE